MSGLSFRPRPIDISKPIPIIRADSEDYEEIIKLAVTVPKIATGMDPEDEEEKHIQEAIKRSLNAQPHPSDYAIPTPTFKVVVEPDEPPFERKTSYIHYHVPSQEELDAMVEYDLGDGDHEWLEQYNKELKGGRKLSEDGLEYIIDRLEKAYCYSKTKSLTQAQAEKVVAEDDTRKVQPSHVGPVYKYWMKKRKGRKQPLLERFHEPPAFDDPSPLIAFRPREPFLKQQQLRKQPGNRKNDKITYNRMTQLRREFERSRMLLEMIKKREKLKRDQIQIALDLFELRATEGVPLTDDPREVERERELQRERATLVASSPSLLVTTRAEKAAGAVEHPRKRRRRDSSLIPISSSSASPSLASSSASIMGGDRGRPPAPAAKRLKTIVKLTSGHVFPADFRPTTSAIPDFMALGGSSQASASVVAALALRERDAREARLKDLMRGPPRVPYPVERDGRVFVGAAIPPFRGRVRIGRGGRVLFDRFPSRRPPPYEGEEKEERGEEEAEEEEEGEENAIIGKDEVVVASTTDPLPLPEGTTKRPPLLPLHHRQLRTPEGNEGEDEEREQQQQLRKREEKGKGKEDDDDMLIVVDNNNHNDVGNYSISAAIDDDDNSNSNTEKSASASLSSNSNSSSSSSSSSNGGGSSSSSGGRDGVDSNGPGEEQEAELPGLDEVDLEFEVEQAFQALENGDLLPPPAAWPPTPGSAPTAQPAPNVAMSRAVHPGGTEKLREDDDYNDDDEKEKKEEREKKEKEKEGKGGEEEDFGARLARVLRKWRAEEAHQRREEREKRRTALLLRPHDDGSNGAAREEVVVEEEDGQEDAQPRHELLRPSAIEPRVDLVARYRQAFGDASLGRTTASANTTTALYRQPTGDDAMDEDLSEDDDEEEEGHDDDDFDDEDEDDGNGVEDSEGAEDEGARGDEELEHKKKTYRPSEEDESDGMEEAKDEDEKPQSRDKDHENGGEEDEDGKESMPEVMEERKVGRGGGRDSLSNIWAPSLMT